MKNRLKDMRKHVKKYGFWGAVAAVLTAFTVVYLIFRVRSAFEQKEQ